MCGFQDAPLQNVAGCASSSRLRPAGSRSSADQKSPPIWSSTANPDQNPGSTNSRYPAGYEQRRRRRCIARGETFPKRPLIWSAFKLELSPRSFPSALSLDVRCCTTRAPHTRLTHAPIHPRAPPRTAARSHTLVRTPPTPPPCAPRRSFPSSSFLPVHLLPLLFQEIPLANPSSTALAHTPWPLVSHPVSPLHRRTDTGTTYLPNIISLITTGCTATCSLLDASVSNCVGTAGADDEAIATCSCGAAVLGPVREPSPQ